MNNNLYKSVIHNISKELSHILLESTDDLFSDVFNDNDDNLFNVVDPKYYSDKLPTVIINLFGTNKIQRWKFVKDNNSIDHSEKFMFMNPDYKISIYSKYITNVTDILEEKGFKCYKAPPYKQALSLNMTADEYCEQVIHSDNQKNVQKYTKWLTDVYPTYPLNILNIFKNERYCNCIWMSEDEGIICKHYQDELVNIYRNVAECPEYCVIELTGNVSYFSNTSEVNGKKAKTEEDKKKILFFNKILKNNIGSSLLTCTEIKVIDGKPIGILYFNWKQSLQNIISRKYDIPKFILQLVYGRNFNILNSLERDDKKCNIELTGNGIVLKVYKNKILDISKPDNSKNINKFYPYQTPNSSVLFELTDYALDFFEERFQK